ncbi:adenylate/guanylate cyclase with integral membrane sensor [Salinisphaera sp. PC39]|uniref:adenylate/guanylate cyclase domain-containing protein n=1 Tax=Salinisphaera sp. PC39 TaxID=1304156 RepID=UPI0033409011
MLAGVVGPRGTLRGIGDFVRLWRTGSRLGLEPDQGYPQRRRIALVNQMAMLAAGLTLLYGVGSLILDWRNLWPLALAAPPEIAAYLAVLRLNRDRRYHVARIALVLLASVQLTFAAWLVSNEAGVQLYFFVLWVALFLLYARDNRWISVASAALWLALYFWIQLDFDTPNTMASLSPDFLKLYYFFNALGAFAFIGLQLTLFYTEIDRTERLLQEEYRRSEDMLRNILPASVAHRLKRGPQVIADGFPEVTLLFADIVGFTRLADKLPPHELVALLNRVFSRFDRLVEAYGLEKIKTVGDEYMLAGGIPLPRADHPQAVATVALRMLETIAELNEELDHRLALRVGIHTGEAVAGVIGSHKFSYDVWGDTVNTASRMQSQGQPNRIQVTEATYERLKDDFRLRRRGTLRVRGKGRMPTWYLLGTRER